MMLKDYSSLRLRCPYCDDSLPSHRDLRVHVGSHHKEKVDEFMEEYFGGRWIEVNFISLMLRKTLGTVTEESCRECGGCDVECPISAVHEGFRPYHVPVQLLEGEIKEILRSDTIWACTNCFACGEDCKAGMPPYDVMETLQNLSARIGYHFPDKYREYNKNILQSGLIQRPGILKMAELTRLASEDVGLPQLPAPPDLPKFRESMRKLSEMRAPL
jgi:heterodisulfide reductase subunit C